MGSLLLPVCRIDVEHPVFLCSFVYRSKCQDDRNLPRPTSPPIRHRVSDLGAASILSGKVGERPKAAIESLKLIVVISPGVLGQKSKHN